jgi:hypothetical protein
VLRCSFLLLELILDPPLHLMGVMEEGGLRGLGIRGIGIFGGVLLLVLLLATGQFWPDLRGEL